MLLIALLMVSCEFHWKSDVSTERQLPVCVERYDRIESRYLVTGDFSALQEMNMEYPIETRTLIEKVLQLGSVEDYEINNKLLRFYRDSVLQVLIADAESQYANMDDINEQFNASLSKLKEWLPDMPIPRIYTQIGALDQSIIIGENTIGISLDKYMGENYSLYRRYYSPGQRSTMTRASIVPDGLTFYLLSLYPMSRYDSRSQLEKDLHMGKVMWVVNKSMGKDFFDTRYVQIIDNYIKTHPYVSIRQLLLSEDYSRIQP